MRFDLMLIQGATQRAKDYAEDTVRRVTRYLVDSKHELPRRTLRLCRWCMYRASGGVVGQAFTEYTCIRCKGGPLPREHRRAAPLCALRDCVGTLPPVLRRHRRPPPARGSLGVFVAPLQEHVVLTRICTHESAWP